MLLINFNILYLPASLEAGTSSDLMYGSTDPSLKAAKNAGKVSLLFEK